jgi:hypothetical protein
MVATTLVNWILLVAVAIALVVVLLALLRFVVAGQTRQDTGWRRYASSHRTRPVDRSSRSRSDG